MNEITIYTDGGSRGNPGPAAIGVHVVDVDGQLVLQYAEMIGNATNNFAEYQAVATGLEQVVKKFGKKTKDMRILLRLDSELVKKQLNSEYQIKDAGLIPLFILIHNLRVANFPNLTLEHVRREFNKDADALVNQALDAA
jgi:ribonuclease HI